MKRTIFVMAVVLGLATAASAATLSVVSDKSTYNVGETITLTLTGNSQGEIATTYSLIGRLQYNAALADAGTVGVALNPGPGWSDGGSSQADGFVELFNFADFGFTGNAPAYNGNVVINTATLIAQATGIVNLDWSTALSFFSIQGARPGTSFEIIPAIPEPTTAALLGLGLLGLAVGGRRRS